MPVDFIQLSSSPNHVRPRWYINQWQPFCNQHCFSGLIQPVRRGSGANRELSIQQRIAEPHGGSVQ